MSERCASTRMPAADAARFAQLDFEAFRALALDPTLSRHEKVGFPDDYREGRESAIFADMLGKLGALQRPGARVLEIGPGCSELPRMLADHVARQGGRLTFVDSAEMLALLPRAPHVRHAAGRFPDALGGELDRLAGTFDVIIAYSVLQYVFAEGNLFGCVDACLSLLAEGGEALFGDLPNTTMRKRFFAGAEGYATHRRHTGRDEAPAVSFNRLEPGAIDDAVVLGLLARCRAQGFHAWVVPQREDLPMANRREDILIRRP
jgi:2-polyprenyl-3-methyl-5-hydroxy-6-metoxy-1,4-benzoquinol methylase